MKCSTLHRRNTEIFRVRVRIVDILGYWDVGSVRCKVWTEGNEKKKIENPKRKR